MSYKKVGYRPRLTIAEQKLLQDYRNNKGSNVLAIGDLHEPFTLPEYLNHCIETKEKYNCDKIVFIGDVIDNHYSSYHESDPNGLSGGDELQLAIDKLQNWYKEFPNAIVTVGNHDRLIRRKAFSGGIPKQWIKEYSEVLNVPNWKFTDRHIIDNVQYIHGESGRASKKAKDDMMSTVQGHRHTEMFTEFVVGANFKVFGCAVGCGIDNNSYAMAYGKNFKKPAIGCAVIFNGDYALNIPMEL
jgi:metallophosphoesterase superfamily enzyme